MLFINLLCLLYLMVLIDSHTISKSIDNDVKVDDIFDSINDLDHTRNPKLRRDRFQRKYRADYRDEFVKPTDILKETKLYAETERTTEKTSTKTTIEHTKHHKSAKRRVGSFWRKFRGKDKKNKHDSNQRKRRIPKNRAFASKYASTKEFQNSAPRIKSRRKTRNQFTLRQPELSFAKRDLSGNIVHPKSTNRDVSRHFVYSTRTPNTHRTTYKLQIGVAPQIDNMLKNKFRINTVEPERVSERVFERTDNLSGLLATMTTQISHLKEMYGLERHSPNSLTVSSSFDKSETNIPPPTTTILKSTEVDFPGTAQIEELLNDIKFKAIQMVSEQNPLVTDIITNTVTEATFEADPILTHIGMAGPGYYLSTFVSINDIANLNEKRTVSSTETNDFNANNAVLIPNTESHYLAARSLKEDTMTMAHNVEDMLQRELKNIYNKVKHKVSSDFRKEMHKAKSTIKESMSKVSTKCKTKKTTTPTTTTSTTTTTPKPKVCHCKNATEKVKETTTRTSAPRHSRGNGKYRKDHDTPEPEAANPKPTYDDYMMLTLYEQMLAKTHEENVRNMLATTDLPPNSKKRREHFRLSKRNPETLTDVKLREDIQKLYNDGVTMPDYDYIDPSANVSSTGSSTAETNMDDNIDPTGTMGSSAPINIGDSSDLNQNNATTPMSTVTDSNLSDYSFEGLSNKISYNDFVNGYRHYLKFQKDQSNQNFSNLIKYQAHRHHSVDDIGKFILNKIPPLPSKRRKRFFDDTDIEYQEITTKSDDSWFRKHFYLFLDNGPPKKFHTSQTVELKSAITEHDTKIFMTDPVPRQGSEDQVYIRIGSDNKTRNAKDISDLSLDDLTRILESIKDKQSTSSFFRGVPKALNESFMVPLTGNYNTTDDNAIEQIRMLPQSFIGKLFSNKRRQAPKRIERITTEYFAAVDMFTENPLGRLKRTVLNEDHENTIMDDFINKDLEEKSSTGAKEVYADAAARSNNREANKYGYLDIDLVPRQTAVVKLRENPKKSRFKNFFKKFHFKRDKAKSKHAKRSCYYNNNVYPRRKTRFNPIKKLKDIFRVRPEDKDDSPSFRLPSMPDYDMMTSHIETFKPIKYDKPMTIDEMQKQIPNISDIISFDTPTTKRTTSQSSFVFRLDENDRNLLYNYHMPSSAATKNMLGVSTAWLDGGVAFTGLRSVYKAKQTATITKTLATTTIRPSTTKGRDKQKISPSNVMTVNVKTLKPVTTPSTTRSTKTETTSLMTLDDINVILNKIQNKLQKSSKNFPRISTPYYKRGTLNFKKYASRLPFKGPQEELTIKSKLTRIAKFPISKRHYKISPDDSQPIYVGNDYLSFHDGSLIKEYIHQSRNRNASPERKKAANMKKSTRPYLPKFLDSAKYRYTDYFNDLLMWHNDILNLDKVPSPIWKNILKTLQSESGESYTTPNMNNLLRELNEMNEFLDEGNILSRLSVTSSANASMNVGPKPYTNNTGIRSIPNLNLKNEDVIRSVAMDDNTLVTSKDLIIKGEAKYYQYNKPKITDSQLKSSDFITKRYKLKVYKNEGNAKVKGGLKRSKSPSTDNNEPAILVDTTIMAYDDDADSVTKDLEVKKLSRNSQKSTKAAPTKYGEMNSPCKMANGPFLKTNKAPMQYYTTPLPMKSYDFNKFLKENKLDVESVTSPILELPSFNDNWTRPTTRPTFTETTDHTSSVTNATIKTKKVQLTTQRLSKIENLKSITNALDNSIKFANKLIVKPSPVLSQRKPNAKNTFLDDFDRYKRYSELIKLPRNPATISPNKATQEFNYYNRIKNKMKERLFEKKANGAVEHPTTDLFTLDPRNKEVEITIINFDDIDKITTPQPYESYAIPSPSSIKKEDNAPFPDFTDRPEISGELALPKSVDFMQKEEMHNGLLYKDIFKESTTGTTTEFTTLSDFTKSTEYVDPIVNDLPTATINKLRYPFDKMPEMYPNILGKMPHAKKFNVPKRVHISSHHYKYDIFYDDNKKTIKSGFEVFHPKHGIVDPETAPDEMQQQIQLTNVQSPTSGDGTRSYNLLQSSGARTALLKRVVNETTTIESLVFRNGKAKTEMIKKIDRTSKRNRYVREASATERTNKHRLFSWRGCKPKPEGGTSAPGKDLRAPVRSSIHGHPARVSTQRRDAMSGIHVSGSTASSSSASTAELQTLPGSLVYDLKHLRRTTSSNQDKDQHRLFKISAMIQDRFKSLMKNFTTTKHTESTKRGPKSNSKCTCNCTCRTSTEVTKATNKEESDVDREDLKDEGFSITCGPNEGSEHKTTATTLMTTSTDEIRTTSRHHHYHYHHHHHYQEDDYGMPEETEQHRLNTSNAFKYKGHLLHDLPNDTLYVEPESYNDQAYYEMGPLQRPPTTTEITEEPDFFEKHYNIKRDIQTQNTFTAKDVAALEVIVDLMKNTLSYEEKDITSDFQNNDFIPQQYATKSAHPNDGTNSIQVHIAIPSDFQTGKKRSPLDPVRVRKVFSAKMLSPVDLEYQVHSFEGSISPTSTKSTTISNSGSDGLSPGMYLLIDKPRDEYALKPVKAKIKELKTRQVAAETTASMSESKPTETREETTSLKSLAKVTLSKDFIAVVNKHLIEMYENMSRVNKEVPNKPRMGRSVWKYHTIKEEEGIKRGGNSEKYICKRRIDWEAVKKYFGHDRVCNCKCKANKAMCRACAASDAVIDELIFEFDNIGRYMKDHCTEIQTFFWMNPSGGQKLRESVSRIDKSLEDYYKRVKGKCQGRTCKTFTTYIDKRQIVKTSKVLKQDVFTHLINDLAAVAEDINKTVSLKACFNNKLKEEGEKFVHAINKCIMKKSFDKRSNPNTTKMKLIKNVYSLDNINVNIICNPEATSTTDEYEHTAATMTSHQDSTPRLTEHLFDYDFDDTKLKKHKGLKKLFPRKNKKRKLFTYFVTENTKIPRAHYKREINNNVATPLISDGGGAFWYDYIKASTNEPRILRDSLRDKSNIEIAVVQKGDSGAPKIQKIAEKPRSKDTTINTIHMTVKTTPKRNFLRDTEATTDYLTHNINQLLQLFGSLQDIESMNMHSNQSTMFLSHPTTTQKEANAETLITTKSTKCVKKVKTKMHYKGDTKEKTTTQAMHNTYFNTTTSSTSQSTPPLDSKLDSVTLNPLESIETKITGKSNLNSTSMMHDTTNTPNSMNLNKSITIRDTTKMAHNKTSPKTTETTKTLATTSNADTKKTTSSQTSVTHNAYAKPFFDDTEPLTKTTTTSSFLGKLKTATLQFLDNVGHTPKDATEPSSTSVSIPPLPMIVDKISSTEMDAVDLSSQITTHMSPTIVIINEYDNQMSSDVLNEPNKDSEGYRNLLLSIIQYETNKLNDEWHRIAYGVDGDSDENDIKRSVIDLSKIETTKPAKILKPKTKAPEDEYDVLQGVKSLNNLKLPDPGVNTKKPEGLLNKIVSKMGIKVVSGSKKKAAKKPTVREVTKNKKIRRNRKLRTNTWKVESPTMSRFNEKAYDTHRASESTQICDIQATFKHITDLQKTLPTEEFENLVKNISCYQYKNVDSEFFISFKRKGKRWDWIRNKRCLKLHFSRVNEESELDDEVDVVNFDDDSNDSFERFVKGDDGIYKIIKRKKRTVSLEALDLGLRNIPPLTPGENELYVMVGDSVTLDCVPYTPAKVSDSKFRWKTDRKRMLEQDNVEVDGVKITIRNVEPRNAGSYTCCLDHTVQRNVRLSVMTVPAFDVVFLPFYKTEEICSYDDLNAIQRLGTLMAKETRCGKSCSIRIDEPVCQRDRVKGTNSSLIRGTAVISVTPRDLNCSMQCRRDIVSSLVMLCATNTPVLSSIRVVMSKDGVNETLKPWKELVRPVVTHSLRKKDSNGHHEYHKLVLSLSPGKVAVVLNCPAGYYLLPEYKICSSCPPNTSSKSGDNTCKKCPRGTRAEPGAAKCHAIQTHPRRYDWWWYPPCGYLVACCGVVFGCTVCVLLSLIVHVVSHYTDPREEEVCGEEQEITPKTETSVMAAYVHTPRTRPLSPSRVILARFFKPSLTSSRATDSQETKFELWKERNIPPPLPPIDFDI